MALPPLSFDWHVSVADAMIVCGACYAAARTIVQSLRKVLHRLDLHEQALLRAGWLKRDKRTGDLEVREIFDRSISH